MIHFLFLFLVYFTISPSASRGVSLSPCGPELQSTIEKARIPVKSSVSETHLVLNYNY